MTGEGKVTLGSMAERKGERKDELVGMLDVSCSSVCLCFFFFSTAQQPSEGTSRSSSSSSPSSRKLQQLCVSVRTDGDKGLPGIIEGQRPKVPPADPAP